MVIWAMVVGALIGWAWSGFESYGALLGGIAGALAGLGLRHAVRAEIAERTAALRERIDALMLAGIRDAAMPTPADATGLPPRPATIVAPPAASEREVHAAKEAITAPAPPSAPSPPISLSPSPPAAPGALAALLAQARAWLLGGNTVVRIGLVILFIGLSFLVSYAASAGLFPIEMRLAAVAAAGIALLAAGYRTRLGRPGFAVTLQGGGVATIYLTVFAAAKWFGLASIGPALAIMIAVCALGAALALLQRSQALAVTAFAGGFAAPVLLGSGDGGVAILFGYYTLLNGAILAIARQRAWRALNLLGFVATFGIATAWEVVGGARTLADRHAGHAFVIASVLIYLTAAILYARHAPRRLGQVVDTMLLFGPAVAGFGLEVGLLHRQPFGSAFAALGFAALYIALAALNRRRGGAGVAVLNEALLAIGIGFITLAVPLALGARWTSAAWALEGAGAVWVGVRQARWLLRAFGLVLQGVAGLVFLAALSTTVVAPPLVGPGFLGAMLIAAAAVATAWWLRNPATSGPSRWARGYATIEAALPRPIFLVGFAFWWGAWAIEAGRLAPAPVAGRPPVPAFDPTVQPLLEMLAYVLSAWGWDAVGRRTGWRVATWPGRATIAVLLFVLLGQSNAGAHALRWPDWLIWATAIAVHLRLLYLADREAGGPATRIATQISHVGNVWLATGILADGLSSAVERAGLVETGWGDALFPAGLALALVAVTVLTTRRLAGSPPTRWPLAGHVTDYGWIAALPVAALLLLTALAVACTSPGVATPLPYLPLLNPVDLTLGLAMGGVLAWRRALLAAAPPPAGASLLAGRGAAALLGGVAFVMVDTVWLRAAHHLAGVGWDPQALLASFIVQAGLAILWTVIALVLMVGAHRRSSRAAWLVGAALLALTVVKLLLVDMGNAGGAARIVTFIGVGVLMLVVGYAAPLPPRRAATRDEGVLA